MPGKPAARLGDTALDCADPVDTPTGTVVAAGTVFINKLPAAKQGDQIVGVDLHIVMIPSPTGSIPTPLPHPFAGIIDKELESTVKIMGMPAATVGSTATNTPPHIPQGGAFQKPPANKAKIIVGSPNVFIGTGSGGGGGGGSGSVSGKTDGIFPVSVDTSDASSESTEGHYLDMAFDDGEGSRVVGPAYKLVDTEDKEQDGHLSGEIARYGIPEGEGETALKDITMLGWSVQNELTPGTDVKLQIETVGMEDGTKVVFKIYERETDREDQCVRRIDTSTISNDKAEADWTYEMPDKSGAVLPGDGFKKPDYYFTAEACGIKKRAPVLDVSADLEIEVKYDSENGDPVKDEAYMLFLSTGEIRKGKTDASGCIRHKSVPVCDALIAFPNIGLTAAEFTKTNQKIIHTIPVGKPNERFVLTPGIPHLIVIKRQTVRIDVLEAEDTLFRYKSAVFLPDGILVADEKDQGQAAEEQSKVDGLAVIKGFFHFLNLAALRGEDKHVLITGHTDTVGSDNYNAKLSLMRAEVVLSLIEGGIEGRKRFVDHVSKMNTPEDKQQILKWIAETLTPFDGPMLAETDDPKKWNYDPLPKWKDVDPGDIDGQIGPNTNEALRNFKTLFQKKFPPTGYEGATFLEDLDELKSKLKGGAFDDAVWAAVFEIYQAEIEASLSQYGLALVELRKNIKWVDETKRAVGCGETWPIDSRGKDNYRSQSNRRVEILFYDPYELKKYSPGKDQDNEEKPFLPCKGGQCAKEDCHIFKDLDREKGDHETYEPKLRWEYIPIGDDSCFQVDAWWESDLQVEPQTAEVTDGIVADKVVFENAFFHINSAVPLPKALIAENESKQQSETGAGTDTKFEPKGKSHGAEGIRSLAEVLLCLDDNGLPESGVLVSGHAEIAENDNKPKELSISRASAVACLLYGNEESRQHWQLLLAGNSSGKSSYVVADIQEILLWISTDEDFKWAECNPGVVTGIMNTATATALKNFKIKYKEEFSQEIEINSVVDGSTWGAIFDMYQTKLGKILEATPTELKELYRKKINPLTIVGCGAVWTNTSDEMDEQSAGRVDIYIYDPNGNVPEPNCKTENCQAKKCAFFKKIY